MEDGFALVFSRANEFPYRSSAEYRARHILAAGGRGLLG
jgi:hypothetical protein